MRVFDRLSNDEKGMTGLETAIILIAFVTVAAVFGYAVLSAGLFSAEEGKVTIYAGLQEASTNIQLTGSVIATSPDSDNVTAIILTVGTTAAGQPIDMTGCDGTSSATNKCLVSLTTPESYFSNIKWTSHLMGGTGNLMKQGYKCQITIDTTDLGEGNVLSDNLTANSIFIIQIKPPIGAAVTVQRTLPASIEGVMDLN